MLGATAIAVFLLLALVPSDVERRMRDWACRHDHPRLARAAERLATVPAAVAEGTREAIRHVRSLDPALLGAIGFWAFNIAVLWASFHAFGESPPWAVLVMGYFVGMLGNLLPLPGGVGGVDGGMIGAFVAFDVELRPGDGGGAHLPRLRVLAADDPGRHRVPPAASYRPPLAGGSEDPSGRIGLLLYKMK